VPDSFAAPRTNAMSSLGRLVLGAAILFALAPPVWIVATSLKDANEVLVYPPHLLQIPPRWRNFAEIWSTLPLARFLLNSAIVALGVAGIETVVSAGSGFAFARLRFVGRDRLFQLYVLTLLVPGQVTIVPHFLIVRYLGWVDSYAGLIIPPAFTVLGTYMLRQYFFGLPRELDAAARIDGCSAWGVFWRIIAPMSAVPIATLFTLVAVAQWNAFLWPLIVSQTEATRTVMVGLRYLVDSTGPRYHLLMAATVVVSIPTVALFSVYQRGLTRDRAFTGLAGQ
jgi:multiple sugar transport system permease protein